MTERPPSTTREALIAETLGDLARLLEKIDAQSSQWEATQRKLTAANAELVDLLNAIHSASSAITPRTPATPMPTPEKAPRIVDMLRAIETQINEATRRAVSEQLEPLRKDLFGLIRQLAARIERPWDAWLIHAATAACAAALTWCVVALHVQR